MILSRREGETLLLETSDGPIRITLTEYKGQQTRIGIDAPESVRILREELVDRREAG